MLMAVAGIELNTLKNQSFWDMDIWFGILVKLIHPEPHKQIP
jgi:hypothetical protein